MSEEGDSSPSRSNCSHSRTGGEEDPPHDKSLVGKLVSGLLNTNALSKWFSKSLVRPREEDETDDATYEGYTGLLPNNSWNAVQPPAKRARQSEPIPSTSSVTAVVEHPLPPTAAASSPLPASEVNTVRRKSQTTQTGVATDTFISCGASVTPAPARTLFTNDRTPSRFERKNNTSDLSRLFSGRTSLPSTSRPISQASSTTVSNSSSRTFDSPFYSGPTTYGGASAYGRLPTTELGVNTYLCSTRYSHNTSPQIRPTIRAPNPNHNTTDKSSPTLSRTARRILQTLEQYSAAVAPTSQGSASPIRRPEGCTGEGLKRYMSANHYLSYRRNQQMKNSPARTGLQVPTINELIHTKQMQHKQQMSEQSRVPTTEASTSSSTDVLSYSLPQNVQSADREPDKFCGKIKSQLGKSSLRTRPDNQQHLEAPIAPVNLPHISLPITSLPTFDLGNLTTTKNDVKTSSTTPTAVVASTDVAVSSTNTMIFASNSTKSSLIAAAVSSALAATSAPSVATQSTVCRIPKKVVPTTEDIPTSNSTEKTPSASVEDFKFCPPVIIGQSELTRELKKISPDVVFKFCEPISKNPNINTEQAVMDIGVNKPSKVTLAASTSTISTTITTASNTSSNSSVLACKTSGTSSSADKCDVCKTAKECGATTTCETCQKTLNQRTNSSFVQKPQSAIPTGSGDKRDTPVLVNGQSLNKLWNFSIPPNTWECSVCLVRNQMAVSKCPCCQTMKKDVSPAAAPATSFGDKFKLQSDEWECGSCLARNPLSAKTCKCCTVPRVSDVCSSTDGTQAPSKPTLFKGGLFHFGVANSTEKLPSECTFKFGIPTATTSSNATLQSPPSSALTTAMPFQFNIPSTTTTAPITTAISSKPFTFGLSSSVSTADTKTAPIFKFGTPATNISENATTTIAFSAPNMSSGLFTFSAPKLGNSTSSTSTTTAGTSSTTVAGIPSTNIFKFGISTSTTVSTSSTSPSSTPSLSETSTFSTKENGGTPLFNFRRLDGESASINCIRQSPNASTSTSNSSSSIFSKPFAMSSPLTTLQKNTANTVENVNLVSSSPAAVVTTTTTATSAPNQLFKVALWPTTATENASPSISFLSSNPATITNPFANDSASNIVTSTASTDSSTIPYSTPNKFASPANGFTFTGFGASAITANNTSNVLSGGVAPSLKMPLFPSLNSQPTTSSSSAITLNGPTTFGQPEGDKEKPTPVNDHQCLNGTFTFTGEPPSFNFTDGASKSNQVGPQRKFRKGLRRIQQY